MELVKIEGLNPREYEHPLDKKALNTLERTAGLDLLVRKFYELGIERFLRLEFVGSNLKVTPSSLPDIYEILEEVCENLNLKTVPDFYIRPDDYFRKVEVSTNNLQGLTTGVKSPIVIISTASIESFSRSELLFIIGCEIGRIKSQHVLYENIAWIYQYLTFAVNTIMASIPGLTLFTSSFTTGLLIALYTWLRMADYTVDRAGLLACQDINTAMTAMAKIAGLPKKYFDSFNVDDFVTQAREFEGFADTNYNKVLKVLSLTIRDQAFTIARAHELLKWYESGDYQAVLERRTKVQLAPAPNFCRHCAFRLEPSNVFCPSCGKSISA